jgi:predicted regulator of Ras-like GTPase activity (Roadblock/LC7/MglB family)
VLQKKRDIIDNNYGVLAFNLKYKIVLKFLFFCVLLSAPKRCGWWRRARILSQPAQQVGGELRQGGGSMSDINLKLKSVPDVEYALVMTKDGAAVDDTSYEAEALGAYTQFLARFSADLGSQLGVGGLRSVTVHGSEHHLFLLESKSHYLGVSAKGSGNVSALDAEIRRFLAPK